MFLNVKVMGENGSWRTTEEASHRVEEILGGSLLLLFEKVIKCSVLLLRIHLWDVRS